VPGLYDTTDPRPVHFLGIAGAGMSALALAALRRGVAVTGCDLDDVAFHDLRGAGATVHRGTDVSHLDGVRALIVTAAAPPDHVEIVAARERGLRVVPRKQALAELVNGHTVVALAGTHGKTTTTVMTTEALRAAGLHPSGLAGGRVAGWGGNAWLDGDSLWVVEADEYDQAFLTLQPTIAVINNVEADHLECYGSVEAMERAFIAFASRATRVLVGTADPGSDRIARELGASVIRFGLEDVAGIRLAVRSRDASGSVAECHWPDGTVVTLRLALPGSHNLRNAVAALGVVHVLGGDVEAATEALARFTGVGRRFERLGDVAGVTVVDDYAHHPTELVATLEAARQAFPGRRLVAVFQPHLYSRTRAHGSAMGEALGLADLAVVSDVYPAREAAIPGVTGALVADAARAAGTAEVQYVPARDALEAAVVELVRPGDVLLTLGAGDVTRVGPAVMRRLEGEA
jgi:UDP-N-acetylmuramate--alanine ligase